MRRATTLLLSRRLAHAAGTTLITSAASPSGRAQGPLQLRPPLAAPARYLSSGGDGGDDDFLEPPVDADSDLGSELASVAAAEQDSAWGAAAAAGSAAALGTQQPATTRRGSADDGKGGAAREPRVVLERLDRPPARFDLLTSSLVYKWETTAAHARKVTGPLREWATELKYRTGVHMEVEPTHPERLARSGPDDGGYATADEVELTVYLFGSHRGILSCQQMMEALLDEDPMYVRLGVFRRLPDGKGTEWLTLRRINREIRPPDIPPISLKLPGKFTLLGETHLEAALRTLWEETGLTVDPAVVLPTGQLLPTDPHYYWRVPVRYYAAEVPPDAPVLGPQVAAATYVREWDARLLRQSPDPIDRAWAVTADPQTGCAWLPASVIDELQRPLKGDGYMALRYSPPPYAGLDAAALGFTPALAAAAPEVAATATGAETAAATGEEAAKETEDATAEKTEKRGETDATTAEASEETNPSDSVSSAASGDASSSSSANSSGSDSGDAGVSSSSSDNSDN